MIDLTGRDPDMVLLRRLEKDLYFKRAEVKRIENEIAELETKVFSQSIDTKKWIGTMPQKFNKQENR